jgi:hypothetical protein
MAVSRGPAARGSPLHRREIIGGTPAGSLLPA